MILNLAGWIMPFIILLPILIGVVRSESSKKRRYFISCYIVAAIAVLHLLLNLIVAFGEAVLLVLIYDFGGAFVQSFDTGVIVAWFFIDAFMLLISILFINKKN